MRKFVRAFDRNFGPLGGRLRDHGPGIEFLVTKLNFGPGFKFWPRNRILAPDSNFGPRFKFGPGFEFWMIK